MKTITTIALTISILFNVKASGYTEAMQAALQQFGTAKTVADFQSTANSFNRISNMAKDQWLPVYYESQCYILMSFMDNDKIKKDEYLDIAETRINRILDEQPQNDEIITLLSFLYTARLVVDPANRGREYSIKSMGAIQAALKINPHNPRALYLKLSNEVGQAQFFGEDTSRYCEQINLLYTKWDEYNQVEPLYPSWGKPQVKEMMEACK